jgi:hypothetical protein
VKKHIPLFIIITLALISCIDENSLKPVIPSHLFNANSAKTWIEVAHIKEDVNYAPLYDESKRTYTFFENGTFREQQLIHLGSENGRIGKYSVGISPNLDTTLNIYYKNGDQLIFAVDFVDTKILNLSNDSLKCYLETLPYPKVE